MAKKKKINRELLFLLVSISVCFSFMAFTTLFFPAVKMTVSGLLGSYEVEVSGLHAVFGGKVTTGNEHIELTLAEYGFNFMSLLGYLLPLFSSVVSILSFKRNDKLFDFIAAGLCFVGAILIFLEPSFFATVNELKDYITCSLLVGPILGTILSLIAGFVSLGASSIKN